MTRKWGLGCVILLALTAPLPSRGATWRIEPSATTNQLTHIDFVDARQGWIAASGSLVLRTIDGGESWTAIDTDFDAAAGHNTVHFVNSTNGWVSGLKGVARTLDSGSTWQGTLLPGQVDEVPFFNRLFALSSEVAWLVGADSNILTAWRLTVGADNAFLVEELRIDRPDSFYDVHFVDADNGWAVGSAGTIFRIANVAGPPGLELQPTGLNSALNAVYMLDVNAGWVVGDAGVVLHTSDGGESWAGQRSGVTANLNDVHFVDGLTGWAVGAGGLILHTSDGGQSWQREESGVTTFLSSIDFAGPDTGFVVGSGGLILQRVPGVCGDGVVDEAEGCDLGAENGAPSACCLPGCELRAAGSECRGRSGLCDLIEVCSGESAVCPPDRTLGAPECASADAGVSEPPMGDPVPPIPEVPVAIPDDSVDDPSSLVPEDDIADAGGMPTEPASGGDNSPNEAAPPSVSASDSSPDGCACVVAGRSRSGAGNGIALALGLWARFRRRGRTHA